MAMNADQPELAARSQARKKRIVTHRAMNHQDAERWDLEFWQAQSPADRLSAFVALRRDVETVERARDGNRA